MTIRNEQKLINVIQKNVLEITNFLDIFKTNRKINITCFNLNSAIRKMSALFPHDLFLSIRDAYYCKSEIIQFKLMMFNIFSLLRESKTIMIDINDDTDHFDIKIISSPISNATYRLIEFTSIIDVKLLRLDKIHKKNLLSLHMLNKYLRVLSPC